MRTTVRRRGGAAIALAAIALTAGACGRSGSDEATGSTGAKAAASPGITDTEVTIGSSQILTGPASAYAELAHATDAYVADVNARGGVKMGDGKTRRIVFTYYDDAFDPSRAVANMRRLVQQDKVFATFGQAGSSSVSAARDYLNREGVPQLFAFSGDTEWGADPRAAPWTIGCPPAYATEAAFYADHLKRTKPDAKVAVLYQNDDLGKDLLAGFEAAVAGSGIRVVAKQSYAVADPTVDSQVVNLAHSGADVLLDVSTPKFAAAVVAKLHQLDWRPVHLLAAVSASAKVLQAARATAADGIVSYTYVKDPASPAFADDEGVKAFKAAVNRYGRGVEDDSQFAAYTWACTDALVRALEATKEPTREALMDAARHLDRAPSSMLAPGLSFTTDGDRDGFPLESGQLIRWDGSAFQPVGDVVSYEGRTPRVR